MPDTDDQNKLVASLGKNEVGMIRAWAEMWLSGGGSAVFGNTLRLCDAYDKQQGIIRELVAAGDDIGACCSYTYRQLEGGCVIHNHFRLTKIKAKAFLND